MSNTFVALGNIVNEPEIKQVNGTDVLKFKVANNVGYGDRQQTNWISCDLWGQRASSLHNLLSKGREVQVSGVLTLREYTDASGAQRLSPDLRCNEVNLTRNKAADTNVQSVSEHTAPVEDDMPF